MSRSVRSVLVTLGLAAVLTLLVLPRADAQDDNQPEAPAADEQGDVSEAELLASGQQLYDTSCVSCHGPRGEGLDIPGAVDAPSLIGIGEGATDFMLRTGRMPLAQPGPQSPIKEPAYTDREIRALVKYVGSFGDGAGIPAVDIQNADLQRGGELYRANCQPCHNASAIGGALSYGAHAPALTNVEPTQIVEAMRYGPGQMPIFSEDILSKSDADAIARYIVYLQNPDDPGGDPLGHSGPTAEGFVAWFVAVPAAILAVRWITKEHRRRKQEPTDA
jgi:quinol---cytochrome-c reductase cytochrome c subunit